MGTMAPIGTMLGTLALWHHNPTEFPPKLRPPLAPPPNHHEPPKPDWFQRHALKRQTHFFQERGQVIGQTTGSPCRFIADVC